MGESQARKIELAASCIAHWYVQCGFRSIVWRFACCVVDVSLGMLKVVRERCLVRSGDASGNSRSRQKSTTVVSLST